MAHFAELDENNVVLRVVVISNRDCCHANGVEDENLGIAFCKSLYGEDRIWKQTSYNNNIRTRYAGIGYTYDESLDAFIPPKPPYPSWVLNSQTLDWESPVGPMPERTESEIESRLGYVWDENNLQWILQPINL